MNLFSLSLSALISFTLMASAATAQESSRKTTADPASVAYATPYIGMFNVGGSGDTTAQFGFELRANPWDFGLRPTVGANVDHDGGAYVYGGFNWDIELTRSIYLIPNFVAGAYHDGGSKDLGGAIEFRSGIELAYQMENLHRVGVAFNHISNASIYDKNPGAETLLVNYSIPISKVIDW